MPIPQLKNRRIQPMANEEMYTVTVSPLESGGLSNQLR